MSSHSTYSFENVSAVFTHPSKGSLTLSGAGLGSISVSRSNDASAHDTAGDGSVMTSKIIAKNGLLSINVQQTSDAATWLRKLNQYLENSPSTEWTRATCTISSKVMGILHRCTGVSVQKTADGSYQTNGQQIVFPYLCQTIVGI